MGNLPVFKNGDWIRDTITGEVCEVIRVAHNGPPCLFAKYPGKAELRMLGDWNRIEYILEKECEMAKKKSVAIEEKILTEKEVLEGKVADLRRLMDEIAAECDRVDRTVSLGIDLGYDDLHYSPGWGWVTSLC